MKKLNKFIDFTILKPFVSREEVMEALNTAMKKEYYGFCFPPYFLEMVHEYFEEKEIELFLDEDFDDEDEDEEYEEEYFPRLVTVIGFPFGQGYPDAKAQEVLKLEDYPPHEIDFVINLSAVRSKDWAWLQDELSAISNAAYDINENMVLKAIIEAPHWETKILEKLCFLCSSNRIDYIKTSTGFLDEGITIEKKLEVVQNILEITKDSGTKIKLSGGIRNRETAQSAIKMGVHRIGTSTPL